MSDTPTDEQVLGDPGSYTVEQVTSVLARAASDEVDTAKALEADGQNRKGIVGWEPPRVASDAPQFSVERLRGPDGPRITGQPVYVLAGALADDPPSATFTRSELDAKVRGFLKREVSSG